MCLSSLVVMACTTREDMAKRPSFDRDTGTWSNYSTPRAKHTSNSNKQAKASASIPTSGQFMGHVSYYGPGFHGKKTASGETFDQDDMTCAHKTLPFGTKLKVTLVSSNKSVEVRVNDRGPFIKGRAVDLSVAAAKAIVLDKVGVGEARIEIIK